jgi:hypothetical protein
MRSTRLSPPSLRRSVLAAAVVALTAAWCAAAQLSQSYYASTCPNVETLVRGAVTQKLQETFNAAPGTLRLFFHDCFVRVRTRTVHLSLGRDSLATLLDFTDRFGYSRAATRRCCCRAPTTSTARAPTRRCPRTRWTSSPAPRPPSTATRSAPTRSPAPTSSRSPPATSSRRYYRSRVPIAGEEERKRIRWRCRPLRRFRRLGGRRGKTGEPAVRASFAFQARRLCPFGRTGISEGALTHA